ncbi:hypothetical protein ACA910_002507 [Epithemia clementina (nom. ined.)]
MFYFSRTAISGAFSHLATDPSSAPTATITSSTTTTTTTAPPPRSTTATIHDLPKTKDDKVVMPCDADLWKSYGLENKDCGWGPWYLVP